jgi:hypothetical protein
LASDNLEEFTKKGPVAERLVATGIQVIISLEMNHQDKDSLSPALCAGFPGVVPSPKRSGPCSNLSVMSNKIAQVSLDFSGAARMCAGSKGVGADGPAVS